jgi:nicotinate-nucleotide pyrophosphorylase (carboxylating)
MLTKQIIDEAVLRALAEDAPWGDVTSEYLIPAESVATASLVARESGVMAGAEVFAAAFTLVDTRVNVELGIKDGQSFNKGQVLAEVTGPANGGHSNHHCRVRGSGCRNGYPYCGHPQNHPWTACF